MSIIVKTPHGEASYSGLPSFSDLMMIRCGDNKNQRIVFKNGNPLIVDIKRRKKK